MKVNEETNHTHASLDSKNYGYCARRLIEVNCSFQNKSTTVNCELQLLN